MGIKGDPRTSWVGENLFVPTPAPNLVTLDLSPWNIFRREGGKRTLLAKTNG